ncbi:MAG: hypothetical protein GY737_29315, partial [Desulfobacteraceae bacterium]|nr:hypothetical protein [Desulfobacteraceae bacterium]
QAWYTYDYTGQRVSKHVRDASGDQWTSYIGKEYEIRGDNAYKYVFANGKRVARFKTDVPISAIKTQTIPLVPGWNFVAFTLEPIDRNADSVFASIRSLLTEAYTYDSKTGNYRRYAPKRLNVIGPIRAHKGYLLNVTHAVDLTIQGAPPVEAIQLAKGWNLIGFPITEAKPVKDV